MRSKHIAIVACALLWSSGCAGCEDGGEMTPVEIKPPRPREEGEPVGWVQETVYTVGHQRARVPLAPLDSHVCVWSGVRGSMQGLEDGVMLEPNASSGYWEASAWSQHGAAPSALLSMDALCAPRSNFFTPTSLVWFEQVFEQNVLSSASLTHPLSGPPKTIWALSGWSGHMEGGGQSLLVKQNVASELSLIEVAVGTKGPMKYWWLGFGLEHVAEDRPALYYGGNISTSSEGALEDGYSERQLLAEQAGLCYLSRISGDFNSIEDEVRIEHRDGFWWLVAHASCVNRKIIGGGCKKRGHVSARATCYRYNQR